MEKGIVKKYSGDSETKFLKTLTEIQEIKDSLLKIPEFGRLAEAQFQQKQYELWLSLSDEDKIAHTMT